MKPKVTAKDGVIEWEMLQYFNQTRATEIAVGAIMKRLKASEEMQRRFYHGKATEWRLHTDTMHAVSCFPGEFVIVIDEIEDGGDGTEYVRRTAPFSYPDPALFM